MSEYVRMSTYYLSNTHGVKKKNSCCFPLGILENGNGGKYSKQLQRLIHIS